MKLLLLCCVAASAQTWVPHESGTSASLRGVSAVNARVAWASGTGGTYLKTTDGGEHWTAAQVPGAEALDFRDVHAVDERTAYLLSAGTGDKARIYKTSDGGSNWTLQLTNPDADGFFDALAFWDAARGIAIGDPVGGRFAVFTTDDGGAHWQRRQGPAALPGEGAFAASGTCLIARGAHDAWFGTGGARVFHSMDTGRTWQAASTPIRHDKPSTGIFSLAFSDASHGVAVGGDYAKDQESRGNIAVTSDGGRTWSEPPSRPAGFRSAVAWVPDRKLWIAVGTSGSDISPDGGRTWTKFDGAAYNAIAFISSKAGWAVGPKGAIAVFRLTEPRP